MNKKENQEQENLKLICDFMRARIKDIKKLQKNLAKKYPELCGVKKN